MNTAADRPNNYMQDQGGQIFSWMSPEHYNNPEIAADKDYTDFKVTVLPTRVTAIAEQSRCYNTSKKVQI